MKLLNQFKVWLGLANTETVSKPFVSGKTLETSNLEVFTKTPLTPKQIVRRKRSRRAKQARKLNHRIR